MQTHVFQLLKPYEHKLRVCFLEKEDAVRNDTDAARLLKVNRIASLNQVHGNRSCIVHEPMHRGGHHDGMMTDEKDLTLLLRIADCQGFVIYSPEKNVVGVLHAGWKGLLAGTIPEYFKVLNKEWGIEPSETIVCAAPSLCQACSGFTDPAKELPGIDPTFFDGRCVDLRGIAKDQLSRAGVIDANVAFHPDCTRCDLERYQTYRGNPTDVKAGFHNVLSATLLTEQSS